MKKLLYIGNKLAVHGHNPTTIDTLSVLFANEGYHVVSASSRSNKVVRILDMLATLFRHAKTTDFVIIDTYSTANFWYAFLVSQCCRILKCRYIPFLHGGNLPERLSKSPRWCRMIFNNAYRNVAPSLYLKQIFEDFKVPNVSYVPNVIELKEYDFKERIGLKPRLLWVRAFADIYNPKMAVAVLGELQKKYPEASLCMVGPEKDGSLAATKQYAETKKVTVQFTGRLTKKEWTGLAPDFDIFISTTHFDNTPVSVLEAMALGMPVVATNVGGIPYLLTHDIDAQLVGDNAVIEMSEAIVKLIENPDFAREQTKNAYRKIIAFDWTEVKKQWDNLLNNH